MKSITYTKNTNGTYRYSIDGATYHKASKTTYTHVSVIRFYDGTLVPLFHKSEEAAMNQGDYDGNPKVATITITEEAAA